MKIDKENIATKESRESLERALKKAKTPEEKKFIETKLRILNAGKEVLK